MRKGKAGWLTEIIARLVMILAGGILLMSYASMLVNPAKAWYMTTMGLLFVPIAVLNLLLLFWAIRLRSRSFWIPLLALLPSLVLIGKYLQFSSGGEQLSDNTVKIVSYNVGHFILGRKPEFKEPGGSKACMDSVLRFIKGTDADIICLQEVDRGTKRSFGADEPYMMGHILAPLWRWAFVKSFDSNGGEYGNAILSCEEPLSTVRCPLPGVNAPRSLILCEFANYAVATFHASLHEETRLASVATLERLAKTFPKPLFIAGDWNDVPDSRFLRAIGESFAILSDTSVKTAAADKPTACIDYVPVE